MNDMISKETQAGLEAENKDIVSRALSTAVKSEADSVAATSVLSAIKGMKNKVEDTFQPSVSSAKKAYDDVRGLRDRFLKPLAEAEAALRQRINLFLTAEQDRRDKLQAEADRKFEKAAAKAERTGAVVPVMPTFIPKVASADGSNSKKIWSAKVIDIKKLCAAVASGSAPEFLVLPAMPALNSMAKSKKSDGEIVPGVIAVGQISISVRGA